MQNTGKIPLSMIILAALIVCSVIQPLLHLLLLTTGSRLTMLLVNMPVDVRLNQPSASSGSKASKSIDQLVTEALNIALTFLKVSVPLQLLEESQ